MKYSLLSGSGDANTGQPEHLISSKVSGISNLPTNLSEMGKLSWTAQVGANHQLLTKPNSLDTYTGL
jgi:hypothetical protein